MGAVGDAFLPQPRLVGEAEREDAAVGADAGEAKEVPGAADTRAALEDGVRVSGVALLDAVGGADTGDARADDHDVEVLGSGHTIHKIC